MDILKAHAILSKYQIDLSLNRPAFIVKMAEAIKILEKNNLPLLSPYFKRNKNSIVSIVYQCDCGNTAESHVSNFAQKKVFACKKCNAGKINAITKRIPLKTIESFLHKKGFSVIKVDNYNGELSGSQWQLACKHNHSFNRSGNNIKNIKYCPVCFTESVAENLVRDLIEIHFNKKFPSVRPDFLKSRFSQKNLELDMYNHEMKLAFEYNGIQHYEPIYGEERLQVSLRNDQEKIQLCQQQGVDLIVIKYANNHSSDKSLFLKEIVEKLKTVNIYISETTFEQVLNKKETFENKSLARIETLLKTNNKKLISHSQSDNRVTFECLSCHSTNMVSVPVIMKLKNYPRNTCATCCVRQSTVQSEIRHNNIINTCCQQFGYHFIDILKNKSQHVIGFRYNDNQNNIKLFGSKKYRKYINENRDLFNK